MTDQPRIRLMVWQPPKSGRGGHSWEVIWAGNNALRALGALLTALTARQGRILRMEWR